VQDASASRLGVVVCVSALFSWSCVRSSALLVVVREIVNFVKSAVCPARSVLVMATSRASWVEASGLGMRGHVPYQLRALRTVFAASGVRGSDALECETFVEPRRCVGTEGAEGVEGVVAIEAVEDEAGTGDRSEVVVEACDAIGTGVAAAGWLAVAVAGPAGESRCWRFLANMMGSKLCRPPLHEATTRSEKTALRSCRGLGVVCCHHVLAALGRTKGGRSSWP